MATKVNVSEIKRKKIGNKNDLQQKPITNYFQVNEVYARALEEQLNHGNLEPENIAVQEICVNESPLENPQTEQQTPFHETVNRATVLLVPDNTENKVSTCKIEI